MLKRGFKTVQERVGRGRVSSFASCDSCLDFYKGKGEADETCHSSESTYFDVVEEEGGRIYCCYWRCMEAVNSLK